MVHCVFQNYLGDDQYVFTRINKLYDILSGDEIAVANKLEGQETPACYSELSLAAVSANGVLPHVLRRGVRASASMLLSRNLKALDEQLSDICQTILPMLPKIFPRSFLLKKLGGIQGKPFNALILTEMEILYAVVDCIGKDLKVRIQFKPFISVLPLILLLIRNFSVP